MYVVTFLARIYIYLCIIIKLVTVGLQLIKKKVLGTSKERFSLKSKLFGWYIKYKFSK